jgi:hypothetical protein
LGCLFGCLSVTLPLKVPTVPQCPIFLHTEHCVPEAGHLLRVEWRARPQYSHFSCWCMLFCLWRFIAWMLVVGLPSVVNCAMWAALASCVRHAS